MRKKGDGEIRRFCDAFADAAIEQMSWRGLANFQFQRPLFGILLFAEASYLGNSVEDCVEVMTTIGLDGWRTLERDTNGYLVGDELDRLEIYFSMFRVCSRLRSNREFLALQEQAAIEKTLRRKTQNIAAEPSRRL